MTVTDNGSEFGANPFGGSRFVEACRIMSCSLMNTTAGVSMLRRQIERFLLTCDLRFARKIPGWTTGSASKLGDRKPAIHACLTDDDLLDAFVGYVAEYHATEHRGLDGKTPATAWKEMSTMPEFDDETPRELAEATGGREFGTRIVSIVVPGRASVKNTCKAILKGLNYEIKGNRDEGTFWQRIMTQMKLNKVVGLHLDEVQDSGRFKTGDSMAHFVRRFRNMMQDRDWPVRLILSAAPDAKEFINHDPTLTRRLKPIEMEGASVKSEGPLLRKAILEMATKLDLDDDGLTAESEFIGFLFHAGASCSGLAMKIAIEALGEARSDGMGMLRLSHFADIYFSRTKSDDENNPFIATDWKNIDTRKAMDRYIAQRKSRAKNA